MTISELFQQLAYGELNNLFMAEEGDGTLRQEDHPRIVNYANEALLRLYSKFILSEKDVLIALKTGLTHYHLKSRYALSMDCDNGYILDTPNEPFTGDAIKILAVLDKDFCPLPLNDPHHCESVFTPRVTTLEVPYAETGSILSVCYQAKHAKLSVEDLDAEIILPDVLVAALKAYIAYSVYTHMNTELSTVKAQEHMAIYTNICAEVEEDDTVNSSLSSTNVRFIKNGWA